MGPENPRGRASHRRHAVSGHRDLVHRAMNGHGHSHTPAFNEDAARGCDRGVIADEPRPAQPIEAASQAEGTGGR